jgi:hypothetical protein
MHQVEIIPTHTYADTIVQTELVSFEMKYDYCFTLLWVDRFQIRTMLPSLIRININRTESQIVLTSRELSLCSRTCF